VDTTIAATRNARAIRLKKEARALFWPWCAIMIAGALPVLLPHSSTAAKLNVLGFFFGIPVLATLSLGNEFYHRTFSLWLTQPVSRMQLWAEKMLVMCTAVLSAGVVTLIGMFFFALPQMNLTYNQVAAIAYVIVAMASATYWTLTARSTVGGFILIGCIFWMFYLFVGEMEKLPRRDGVFYTAPPPTTSIIALFALAICLAALMLWLGARKFARFQVTGGSSGEDLLTAGPSVMPEALAEWLRCRPSGATLNLIRKELRLLRPLWVIELLALVYIACLAIFRLLPSPPVLLPETLLQWVVLGPPVMTCLGLAGLAGIVPLGEERTSGTYAWHMSLPISARRQWLVKLIVAMVSGLACTILFPVLTMIAIGAAYGSPLMYVHGGVLQEDLLVIPILIFACFWCACAANDTIRAATWAIPTIAAIPFTAAGGLWLGRELAQTTGTLRDFVVSSFHLSPLAFANITDFARSHLLWLFAPTLLFALMQSFRLFRAQPNDSTLWMLRCILPLVAVTILWSFSASAGFTSSRWEPFDETRRALDKLQPGTTKLELTGEDLAKSSPLTAPTQRWLKGSRIAVAPGYSQLSRYLVTIHLESGLECRLIVSRYGATAASCGKV
jgi:ABC-type transport system involved in multi-copper enzyme maturation permease subunit